MAIVGANLTPMLAVGIMPVVEVLGASTKVVKVVFEDPKERGSLQTSKDLPMPIVSATVALPTEVGTSVFEAMPVLFVFEEVLKPEQNC